MIGSQVRRKTLYLDTDTAHLRLDGHALRVQTASRADRLIPLRRVERAVIHDGDNDLLQACLAMLERGATVHFRDRTGNLLGILQQPWHDGTHWARALAREIEHSSGLARFRDWHETQQRHAWSLFARRNYVGDFEANRKRLIRYLLFFRPALRADHELDWLEQQLWAWLQARMHRDGLQPVARALDEKGARLADALMPCLLLPLLWKYVCWRRTEPGPIVRKAIDFFELKARTQLRDQLQRHLNALAEAYATRGRAAAPSRADARPRRDG